MKNINYSFVVDIENEKETLMNSGDAMLMSRDVIPDTEYAFDAIDGTILYLTLI